MKNDLAALAVYLFKGHAYIFRGREFHKLFCLFWRNRLAALVMADVSLRASERIGKFGLRNSDAVAYRFDDVHRAILAPLLLYVNTGASYHKQ